MEFIDPENHEEAALAALNEIKDIDSESTSFLVTNDNTGEDIEIDPRNFIPAKGKHGGKNFLFL